MRVRHLLSSAAAIGLLAGAGAAMAQAAPQDPNVPIPTVVVEDSDAPAASHALGQGHDTGTSAISRDSVEARAPGSGDVNAILRALPTVQFSSTRGLATRDALQDLRPETLSISGGSINENLFILDGVGVNSYMYDNDANPGDFTGAGVAAASAQTHWVDSSLVGEVVVRDSNVSARYGDFTGGVVEITTRAPSRVFGFETYYGRTTDSMAEYRISEQTLAALGASAHPGKPQFEKERFGFSADLPVNERLRFLVAYNQTSAVVTNFPGALYLAYGPYGQRSLGENYLLKGEYDLPNGVVLSGQVAYAPYESEARQTNTAFEDDFSNLIVSNGGGVTAGLDLRGSRGLADWTLALTFADTNNEREAFWGTYNITSTAPGLVGCSTGSSCTFGGPGDFISEQQVTTLKGDWRQSAWGGDLSLGFEVSSIDAHRERSQDLVSHLTTAIHVGTVCTTGESLACRNGSYALSRQLHYGAFDARADLESYALWAEYRFDVAGFDVRAGLRYDHESFLENHNFAPRLSVTRDLPWAGIRVTGGLNRYYTRSFVGYALREGAGSTRTYQRTATVVGGERRWNDNWVLIAHTDSTRYSGVGLDTPYSDEATLAFTGPAPWIGGEYRLKGIAREGRDMIARSIRYTETYTTDVGGTATRSIYYPTNDAERSYRGLSLEYIRPIGDDHSLTFSANYSHTDATNLSAFDMADETELSGRLVYYNGQVVDLLEALADNQLEDYASPLILNADWGARWWDGRIRTNVNARYRDGFSRVDDTGANISVGGSSYDVYGKVDYSASVDVNLNLVADLVSTRHGDVILDVRVNNLFNSVLNDDYISTTQPYQLGRNAWVSVKYRY